MAQVFRTKKGADTVEIAGVGVLAANGGSVIPVEQAAAAGMSELQKKDKVGAYETDDLGNPVPLSDKELTAAAKAFAEKYDEIEVVSLSEDKVATLSHELPPAVGYAEAEYERVFGQTVPVYAEGDKVADAAVPEPPQTKEEVD